MVRVNVTRESINRAREQYEGFQERQEKFSGIGAEPPDGLIPRGDGFYTTPEVIDPTDCDNWESSPWCGGNPFSNPLTNPASVDVKWGINECGAFVQATGTLLGVEGPTHTVAWLRPECRPKYEQRQAPPFDPPKPGRKLSPAKMPKGLDPDQIVAVLIGQKNYTHSSAQQRSRNATTGQITDLTGIGIAEGFFAGIGHEGLVYPGTNSYRHNGVNSKAFVEVRLKTSYSLKVDALHNYLVGNSTGGATDVNTTAISDVMWVSAWKPSAEPMIDGAWAFTAGGLFYGRWGDLFAAFDGYYYFQETGPGFDENQRSGTYVITRSSQEATVELLWMSPALDTSYKHPPPPDDNRKCCMECCSNSQQNENNDLLRQILREVKKANKRIGSDDFPTNIPETLNTQYADDGTDKKEPSVKPVQSLRELIERHIIITDGIMGEWEIPIKITDVDPEKEGDQSKTIVLKNMSEAISDLYALAFDTHLQTNQCLRMLIKTIVEAGSGKKAATQSYYLIKSVADYLDFKQKEKTIKVAMGFTPGKEKYEEFVDEFEQEIRIITFEENDKNSRSFADDLNTLLHAAAITRAAFFRKLNKDDIKGSLVELLTKMSAANKEVEKGMQTEEDDFDAFIKDAETQFAAKVNNPELVNPLKPYGVDFSNRPKIRRVRTGVEEDQQPGS